jgi:hypothetical protein
MTRFDADNARTYSTFSGKHGNSQSIDDALLESMGYEQRLHRGLNTISNFAFGFTEVAILASLTSLYGYGLKTGGKLRAHYLSAG